MVGSGIPSSLCSWSEYFAGSDEGPETVLTNSPAVFFLIL